MRFLIDRLAFRDALQRVEMAIDRKPTRPILGGVFLRAEGDVVTVIANDQEIAARYRVEDVQVDQPGWAVVPGRELVEVVRDFQSETVTVALNDQGQVEFEAGEDRCLLVSMEGQAGDDGPPSLFPLPPVLQGQPGVVLDKSEFLRMVGSTRFATSRTHDSRFATEGVLFELRDGHVVLVGTDGRRLACIRRPALEGAVDAHRAVLLPRVLDQLLRFGQEEASERLEAFLFENQVGFRLGRLEAFGRVLQGEFPKYDNVIPKSGRHVVRARREPFSQKLRLASHLTQDAAAVVRLEVSPRALEISAEHEGRGRAAGSLDVDYSGEGLTASFNPDYLLDGLKAAHLDEIEIQMEEATRPAKFVLGEDYTYVVMPLSNF